MRRVGNSHRDLRVSVRGLGEGAALARTHGGGAARTPSRLVAIGDRVRTCTERLGIRRSPRILNLDYLPTPVHATVRADVVGPLERTATGAGDELGGGEVDVSAPGALMCLADALLWKCSHGDLLLMFE